MPAVTEMVLRCLAYVLNETWSKRRVAYNKLCPLPQAGKKIKIALGVRELARGAWH